MLVFLDQVGSDVLVGCAKVVHVGFVPALARQSNLVNGGRGAIGVVGGAPRGVLRSTRGTVSSQYL